MDIHNQNKIYELDKVFSNNTITTVRSTSDEWVAAGNPREWILVETDGDYSVYVDVAYGRIALFINDTLLSHGIFNCNTFDVVVLDRDYYGVKKYIWK